MSGSLTGSDSVFQVGSSFLNKYYHALINEPHRLHHFYRDVSSIIHIVGHSGQLASSKLGIQKAFLSLNYSKVHVNTLNGLDSVCGGMFLMVTGFVTVRNIPGRRKFVQIFFLAPQPGGFFVLNDIFRLIDSLPENPPPSQNQNPALPLIPDPTDPVLPLIPDPTDPVLPLIPNPTDPVLPYLPPPTPPPAPLCQKPVLPLVPPDSLLPYIPPPPGPLCRSFYLPEDLPQQQPQPEPEPEPQPLPQPQPQPQAPEQIFQEVYEKTYASVLRASAARPQPPRLSNRSASTQPPSFASVPIDKENIAFVRNLPLTVCKDDFEEVMSQFGKVNGISIISQSAQDRCFAHVEYQDSQSVRRAIQVSPMQYEGRSVSIFKYDPSFDKYSDVTLLRSLG